MGVAIRKDSIFNPSTYWFKENGQYINGSQLNNFDLISEYKEEIVRWVNLYEFYGDFQYNSREDADSAADVDRLACKKVIFKEGEFDE